MFVTSNNREDFKPEGVCQTMYSHPSNGEIDCNLFNVNFFSRFCMPVCSREVKVREAALHEIEQVIELWLDRFYSRTSKTTPTEDKEFLGENGTKNENQNNLYIATYHIPTLLRLSVACPFEDVRVKCCKILQTISERGVLIPFHKVLQGPSNFIPPDELIAGVCCGDVEGVRSPVATPHASAILVAPQRHSAVAAVAPRRRAFPRIPGIYEEMTGEVLNELRDPTWILDRRNSGKLFWRRDSVSATEKNRVKFRCDVEVVEYLRVEPEPPQYEDWSSDEEDERYGWRLRPWEQEIPPPSSFWGGVCMLVIAAVITYQWLSV